MLFARSLATYLEIIFAIILREAQIIRNSNKFGLLKVYATPLTWMLLFTLLRPLLLGSFRVETFELPRMTAGFILFYMFRELSAKIRNLGKPVGGIFSFPGIQAFDLFLAWTILYYNLYMFLLFAMLGFSHILGSEFSLSNWTGLVVAPILLALFGLGYGMTAWSTLLHYPWLRWFFSLLSRLLFWVSGVFFFPTSMPLSIQERMAWNPICNCLEMVRDALGLDASQVCIDYRYVATCTVLMLLLGVLLCRKAGKAYRMSVFE